MTYYGLSFAADQLAAGGLFTNFLLSMAMDFPATGLVLILLDRWGRRRLHTVGMVMGGIACLLGVLTTMVAPDRRFDKTPDRSRDKIIDRCSLEYRSLTVLRGTRR